MLYVTCRELNKNVHPHTNESVMRVSTDTGQTFGPVINLGANGTMSTTTNGNTTETATTLLSQNKKWSCSSIYYSK